MSMNTELQKTAKKAAMTYLKSKGYRLLETENEDFDLVAKDDRCIVFVDVAARIGKFPEECLSRASRLRHEEQAGKWLSGRGEEAVGCQVRFDRVDLNVMSDTNAFVRHHIDAFN